MMSRLCHLSEVTLKANQSHHVSSICCDLTIVLSQYASITLPFQIVFNGRWPRMSLYIEKGLMMSKPG